MGMENKELHNFLTKTMTFERWQTNPALAGLVKVGFGDSMSSPSFDGGIEKYLEGKKDITESMFLEKITKWIKEDPETNKALFKNCANIEFIKALTKTEGVLTNEAYKDIRDCGREFITGSLEEPDKDAADPQRSKHFAEFGKDYWECIGDSEGNGLFGTARERNELRAKLNVSQTEFNELLAGCKTREDYAKLNLRDLKKEDGSPCRLVDKNPPHGETDKLEDATIGSRYDVLKARFEQLYDKKFDKETYAAYSKHYQEQGLNQEAIVMALENDLITEPLAIKEKEFGIDPTESKKNPYLDGVSKEARKGIFDRLKDKIINIPKQGREFIKNFKDNPIEAIYQVGLIGARICLAPPLGQVACCVMGAGMTAYDVIVKQHQHNKNNKAEMERQGLDTTNPGEVEAYNNEHKFNALDAVIEAGLKRLPTAVAAAVCPHGQLNIAVEAVTRAGAMTVAKFSGMVYEKYKAMDKGEKGYFACIREAINEAGNDKEMRKVLLKTLVTTLSASLIIPGMKYLYGQVEGLLAEVEKEAPATDKAPKIQSARADRLDRLEEEIQDKQKAAHVESEGGDGTTSETEEDPDKDKKGEPDVPELSWDEKLQKFADDNGFRITKGVHPTTGEPIHGWLVGTDTTGDITGEKGKVYMPKVSMDENGNLRVDPNGKEMHTTKCAWKIEKAPVEAKVEKPEMGSNGRTADIDPTYVENHDMAAAAEAQREAEAAAHAAGRAAPEHGNATVYDHKDGTPASERQAGDSAQKEEDVRKKRWWESKKKAAPAANVSYEPTAAPMDANAESHTNDYQNAQSEAAKAAASARAGAQMSGYQPQEATMGGSRAPDMSQMGPTSAEPTVEPVAPVAPEPVAQQPTAPTTEYNPQVPGQYGDAKTMVYGDPRQPGAVINTGNGSTHQDFSAPANQPTVAQVQAKIDALNKEYQGDARYGGPYSHYMTTLKTELSAAQARELAAQQQAREQ